VVVLFIVEALIITPACIAWMWWLVSRAEQVRLTHYGLMASVPLTSLTLMATRPVKVIHKHWLIPSSASASAVAASDDDDGLQSSPKKSLDSCLPSQCHLHPDL
jgi:hypothetical protein